jgi:hypothetical protein
LSSAQEAFFSILLVDNERNSCSAPFYPATLETCSIQVGNRTGARSRFESFMRLTIENRWCEFIGRHMAR